MNRKPITVKAFAKVEAERLVEKIKLLKEELAQRELEQAQLISYVAWEEDARHSAPKKYPKTQDIADWSGSFHFFLTQKFWSVKSEVIKIWKI